MEFSIRGICKKVTLKLFQNRRCIILSTRIKIFKNHPESRGGADLEKVLALTWILSFRPTSFWEYALFSDIFEIVINGVI